MRKIAVFMTILSIASMAKAQDTLWKKQDMSSYTSIPFCGASTDYVSKINDAYSSYRAGSFDPGLASPFHFTPQANFPTNLIVTCGIFRLYYDDLQHTPLEGFADPVLGAARRATLCAVLSEIQSTIAFVPGDTLDIFIDRSFTSSNPYTAANSTLAFAGPSYPTGFTVTPGIYNGAFFDHTTSGVDPDPNNYDMSLTVNFHRVFSNGSYQSIFYQNDYTNMTANCQFDLFSVLLHEITHGMGFLSLVTEDPTTHLAINGNSGSTFNNAYSRFDSLFLYKGNILTGVFDKIVDASVPGSPVINTTINAFANPLRSNDIWIYNNGNPINQPIYSGEFYVMTNAYSYDSIIAGRSLLSHFALSLSSFVGQSQYSPGYQSRYVMGPFFDVNEHRRTWAEPELRSLLALGYSLNAAYAASPEGVMILTNTPPHRSNPATPVTEHLSGSAIGMEETPVFDFTLINNNSPILPTISTLTISIPGLLNIAGANADPVSIAPGSLFGIRGVSTGGNNHNLLSINGAGTSIVYTPEAGYVGIAQFGFWLFDGKEVGAFKTITINVTPGTYVPAPGSELLINGDFEDRTEVRTTNDLAQAYSTIVSGVISEYLDGAHLLGGQPYSTNTNGWGPYGAGVIIDESENLCSSTTGINPVFGYSTNSSRGLMNGNFHPPVHTIPAGNSSYRHSTYGNQRIYFTLSDSLRPRQYYIAEFDVSFIHNPLYPTTIGTQYTYGYEGAGNPVGMPYSYTVNYSHTENDTVREVCINTDTMGHWVHIVDTFQYCSTTPSKFLVFRTPNRMLVNMDNFSLRQDTAHPVFDTVNIVVSSDTICENDSTLLTAVPNIVPECPVTYTWNPGSLTGQSVYISPSTSTVYTVTASYAGTTLTNTVSLIVIPSAVSISPASPTVCSGSSITLTASGATTYSWSANAGSATTNTVSVAPTVTTTYTVTGTTGSCSTQAVKTVTVNPTPSVMVSPSSVSICSGSHTSLTASGATTYSWAPSTGLSATTGSVVTASPTVTTTYTVSGTSGSCSAQASATVTVNPTPSLTVTPVSASYCVGTPVNLTASGATTYSWSPSTGISATTGSLVAASPSVTTIYTVTGTSGSCSSVTTATVGPQINTCTSSAAMITSATSYSASTNMGLGAPSSIAVMADITFTGGSNNLLCYDVRIAPGVQITVKNGATLTIGYSWLHSCASCNGGMWDGIYVENGGKLVVGGGTVIEDATNAIETQPYSSGTAIPDIQLNKVIFNKNTTGIYLNLLNNPNNLQAAGIGAITDDCIFTCRNISSLLPATSSTVALNNYNTLKNVLYNNTGAYATTVTKAGVRSAKGIDIWSGGSSTYHYIIGEAGTTTGTGAGKLNIFDYLDYGIFSRSGYISVKNSLFQNMTGSTVSGVGYGIYSQDYSLSVGSLQTVANANEGNYFKNNFRGMHVYTARKIYIYNNTFNNAVTSTYSNFSTSGNWTGQYGMYIYPYSNATALTMIQGNSISNCALGIHMLLTSNYTASGISVLSNTITANGTANNYCNKGVFIEAVSGCTNCMASQSIQIKTNTITNIEEKAIHASYIQSGLLIQCNDELSLRYRATGGTMSGGASYDVIRLDNCMNSRTDYNSLIRTSNGNTAVANEALTGIYINNSGASGSNNNISDNDIRYLGSCVVWQGSNPTSTVFYRNIMANAKYGLYMNTNAAFNSQPSASVNQWATSGFTKQTYNNNGADINVMAKITCYTGSAGIGFTYVPTNHSSNVSNGSVAYTTGSAGTNGIITSSTPPPSCPSCTPPCGGSGGGGGGAGAGLVAGGDTEQSMLMHVEAAVSDNTESEEYDQERKWLNKKWSYETLQDSAELKEQSSIADEFYTETQSKTLGLLSDAEEAMQQGNPELAASLLQQAAPENLQEQNLLDLYNQLLQAAGAESYVYRESDKQLIYAIAAQCELSGGPAVGKARALYNLISNGYVAFENSCLENAGRKKAASISKPTLVTVHPNPTTGSFTIDYPEILSNESSVLQILSSDGRLLKTIALAPGSSSTTVDAELTSGIYLLKLERNGSMIYKGKLAVTK